MSLLLVVSPFFAFSQQSADVLKILQLTDVHICNLVGYHPAFVASRQHYGNGMEPLSRFLTTMPKQLDVDALIITGDLIDYYEAETAKGTWLSTQIEQFALIYKLYGIRP